MALLPALFFHAAALADAIHVTAIADPGLPLAQSRPQALERGLAEAVQQEAVRLLHGPVAAPRLAALRAHLAPLSLEYVRSYQENARPASEAGASPQPYTLDLEVDVQRPALRQMLVRLGFLAGSRHPAAFVLRLGPGVKEKDAQALDQGSVLLGLSRSAAASVEVQLERLPQGYYKALLRQGNYVLAADASELAVLWLEVWGKYFSDPRQQPGPGLMRLTLNGFANADAVLDFVKLLGGWDTALLEPRLSGMDMDGAGISAAITCRVINQQALDALLKETLPGRKLGLASQEAVPAP